MTKDEKEELFRITFGVSFQDMDRVPAEYAMLFAEKLSEITAKQQCIEFANWINSKQYIENGNKSGLWYKRGGGVNSYSTETLYEKFLTTQPV